MTSFGDRESSIVAPAFVDIRDASLTYGEDADGVLALQHCTLGIGRGEFSAVVGPSGCGKSTLFKLISGLRAPTGGEVAVAEAPVRGPLKIVGMAFQNPTLLPWRTALDNVLLPMEVVEPHRYTRVRDLFHEFASSFADADSVIVGPLYTAGEAPIDGISHGTLAEAIRAGGHREVTAVDSEREIAPMLRLFVAPGDMVVCLGAGNSTEWAHALPEWLAAGPRGGGAA